MFPFPTVVFFQGHQELSNRENKSKYQKFEVLFSVILILQNQGLESILYFSVKSSRLSTSYRQERPACFQMYRGGELRRLWPKPSPARLVDLILIPRLDSVHLKPRWPPLRIGARSRRSYGKIGQCEQSRSGTALFRNCLRR